MTTHEPGELLAFTIMNENNTYKYFRMPQSRKVNQMKIKVHIIKEISRRANILGQIRLNFVNMRRSFNEICAPLVNYTTGVIEWM